MTDQIFLNPEDYNDRSIISEAEKSDLEEDIARYRAEESRAMTQATGIGVGKPRNQNSVNSGPAHPRHKYRGSGLRGTDHTGLRARSYTPS